MLPSEEKELVGGFSTFEEAYETYYTIVVGETSSDVLADMGFDILHSSNTQILTYTDVLGIFMSNQNIDKGDLPEGVLECLEANTGCKAYRFVSEHRDEKRYGNFFIDMLNFRKKSSTTGWRFEALVVIVDDIVAYVDYRGERNINLKEVERNPLGPLQGLDFNDIKEAAGH
jgi:hypothetical protein